MKKSYLGILFLSIFISLSACNSSQKKEAKSTASEYAPTSDSEAKKEKTKIEKLDAEDFKMKMFQLRRYNLVDVRTPEEFGHSSIPRAKNISIADKDFEEKIAKLEKYKPLLIYCKKGGRSSEAVERVKDMGFERIIELEGGIDAWVEAKKETARGI